MEKPKTPMPRTVPNPVSVFQFLDAREYLRQACEREKSLRPAFSQRYIARELQASSSSFFADVMRGKSKLTPQRVLGFARLLRLSKKETEYFENLVLYTQAESEAEKRYAFDRLKALGPKGGHALLEAFQMEYFAKWHYAAVRELLEFYPFRGDYAELGKMLNPPLAAAEAQEAVALLRRLKLITRAPHGGYRRTEKVVLSGPSKARQVRPALLGNLDLARRALDAFEPERRPFSYLTLSVSEPSFRQIHEKIRAFTREVFELVTEDKEVDRLYQLNLQFFPLSETVKRRKS
jgi:uncharacterized protein (TIGR02147 family)